MKFALALLSIMTMGLAQAAYHQAPPSFSYKDDKAVFIDISEASYVITYDLSKKVVDVESTLQFKNSNEGFPIFDLVPDPTEVVLDGQLVQTEVTKDPDQETTLRVIQEKVAPGFHELKLKHALTTNVVFTQEGVASGFWMSDLNDRRYLEQYLPANLEFDQYKITIRVKIVGAEGKPHLLKTNGQVSKITENTFEVIYPDFYTSSSLFFHLFLENNTSNNAQFYFPSVDGRLIPVDIYTTFDVNEFVDATRTILSELEADYGPFPHNQLIIYGNTLSGGMEYSGATATSLKALGHELFHSYHARGLMPANGNSGWMDEAIARWRDNKYPLVETLAYESTLLAGHSVWTRKTDRMAYTEGSAFLSRIAFKMNAIGLSFKTFLKDYFQKFKYTTVTTQLFQSEVTTASGLELGLEFDKYIYGKGASSAKKKLRPTHVKDDPFHPNYTGQELLDMTWL